MQIAGEDARAPAEGTRLRRARGRGGECLHSALNGMLTITILSIQNPKEQGQYAGL